MESFKDYLIQEFNVDGTTSISFKFTHNMTSKFDKQTTESYIIHNITVNIGFYDKNLVLLKKESIKFSNNILAKKDSKRLVKIAPKELENRFNSARREIVKSIQDDYLSKIADFDEKLSSLRLYEDIGTPDHDVIQSKFIFPPSD